MGEEKHMSEHQGAFKKVYLAIEKVKKWPIFLIETAERAWHFYISKWGMTQKLKNTSINLRYLLIDINRNNNKFPPISILIPSARYLTTDLFFKEIFLKVLFLDSINSIPHVVFFLTPSHHRFLLLYSNIILLEAIREGIAHFCGNSAVFSL